MKHYVDRQNLTTVYSFDDDCGAEFIPAHLERITDQEATEILESLQPKIGLSNFKEEIQAHLDRRAVESGYDDIKSAVTYADEPSVPKFQAEGAAFRAWRSKVWDYGLTQLSLVESGLREVPGVAEFIGELPAFEAPEK